MPGKSIDNKTIWSVPTTNGKPKASNWAKAKNGMARSFILPAYHPRQYRQQCVQAAISAGIEPTRFYTPTPQQRPEYTLYLTNVVININGIVGRHDGYIQFREGCELGQPKIGRNWYKSLMKEFKKSVPTAATSEESHQQAWDEAFALGTVPFSGKSGEKKIMSIRNVEAGRVLDSVFVMDAIWDYNFHHVLVDSVARLVHW